MADDIQYEDPDIQSEDQSQTEDQPQSQGGQWHTKSVVHKDLQGNVISEQQYNQLAQQTRQLAQQHAQQSAQQQLFKQHPELLAKLIEKQQEQEIKDRSFEKQFTFQQKREYAKRETGHRLVQSSQDFSKDEKEAENREWELYQGGMTLPTVMKNKVYPKGREPGSVWGDPNTDEQYIIGEDGIPRLGAKFNSSKAGQLITQKHEIDKHNLARKDKQHDEIMKFRAEHLFIKTEDPLKGKTLTPRSKDELDKLTQDWLGHDEDEETGRKRVADMRKDAGLEPLQSTQPTQQQPVNAPVGDQPVHIRSKEEYDKAPSGTKFIAPDGTLWEKP